MEEQRETDFQQRWAELFRETERDRDDLWSGRVTVKESRAKQRELGERQKALEQELRAKRESR
jgi:hypothetical protein